MNPNKPVIVLLERGILGWGSLWGAYQQNWVHPAVVWIHKYAVANGLNWRAQTIPFLTTPFTAALTRHRRALALSKLIRAYSSSDWQIVGVSHSEGTATMVEAIRLAGWPRIESLHLLCGAMDSNFERVGLNFAIRTGKVGKVFCYRADRDEAMRLEDTVLGLALFGISWNDLPLGLSGPVNVGLGMMGTKVFESHWPDYGHSDCFKDSKFNSTMEQIVANAVTV